MAQKNLQTELAHTYFGEIPHEFLGKPSVWRVDPEFSRRLWFQIGDVSYEIEYTFSDDSQRLMLSKNSLHEEEYVQTEIVSLNSRRFEDQQPSSSGQIRYHLNPERDRDNELYVDTPLAVQKAREMLAGLSPQAPKK